MVDAGLQDRMRKGGMLRGARALALVGLFVAELLALAMAYQFLARIECQATDAEAACRGLRSLVARAMAVLAVAAVLLWARPGLAARLAAATAHHPSPGFWAALHFGGVGLLLVPLFVAGGADMAPMFARLAPFWAAGALASALGAVLWLAPWRAWRQAAGPDAGVALGALALGLGLPDLADLILPLWWHWPQLTTLTFHAVAAVLGVIGGAPVHVDAAGYIVGVGDFLVHIAHQCSGVEGLALVTGFTLLYAVLFRDRIRPMRYALVVLPLGLVASWCLNVLRIAVLVVIGDRVSPDLAVDGFHSYAGWLFFTLLALGLMWFVQATPWLHRDDGAPRAPAPPLRQDWLAARILPFIVFMIVSTMTSALFFHPELGYPWKAAAMAAVLVFFLPALRGRDWAPGWQALAAGALVGAGWVLAAPADDAEAFVLSQLLTGLGGGLAVWVAARVLGTVVLVPIIEELFFRGYLLARLDRGGLAWRVVALAVSSGLFGLLHGRWLDAAVAGLVFGLLMLWRGRLADAVWAHVAANAVVAGVALMRGDWALI